MMMTTMMMLAVELGCHTRARPACGKGIMLERKGSGLTRSAALRVDPAELRDGVPRAMVASRSCSTGEKRSN
jgi:hypothetical protein